MNDFTLYFRYGWEHIISTGAADHILFIIALTAIYTPARWKQVVILVTAFTIGHSLTLGLSIYDIIRFKSTWVEFLIPVTIMITSAKAIFSKKNAVPLLYNYLPAVFFGLIHGMGFAASIRFMIAEEQSIGIPLLAFNLGLEAGQILLVMLLLGLCYLVVVKGRLSLKWWVLLLCAPAFIISSYMAVMRWPFQ